MHLVTLTGFERLWQAEQKSETAHIPNVSRPACLQALGYLSTKARAR